MVQCILKLCCSIDRHDEVIQNIYNFHCLVICHAMIIY